MPAKIETLNQVIVSKRFKKETNYREYSEKELQAIQTLFDYIKKSKLNLSNGYYLTFCQLVSYDLTNLVERFDWLRINNLRRTKESYIARHGEKVGLEKWNVYCEKQRVKNLYETKHEKYGWTEDEFKTFNKSRAVTKELCIKRHGEKVGLEKWKYYIERQRYTNTLEYFLEKYGSDGNRLWINYNTEKAKSSDVNWIMKKYDTDIDGAVEILQSRQRTVNTSDAELFFVTAVEDALGTSIQYTAKTKQFCIWNYELDTACFYDMADSKIMKIVEFNGDYWHCNPLTYDDSFIHKHAGMTAKQIWNRDYVKIKAATDRGFNVKVIWESDFIKSPETVIKEIVKWWNTK